MEIEKQVCSLEQAKRLKELGVKQESLFYWYENYDKPCDAYVVSRTKEASAYTVAELGEMLPSGYDTMRISNVVEFTQHYGWFGYDLEGEHFPSETLYPTEAQARAAMLIHLLETKTIKP